MWSYHPHEQTTIATTPTICTQQPQHQHHTQSKQLTIQEQSTNQTLLAHPANLQLKFPFPPILNAIPVFIHLNNPRIRTLPAKRLLTLPTKTPMATGHVQALPQTPVPARAEIPPARGAEICPAQVVQGDQVGAVGDYWMYAPET